MKEFCPNCGQSVMKHKHPFTKSLAGMVYSTAQKFGPGSKFHLQKDLSLTKNQYNNFQKLRYWELVRKVYVNGVRQGGYWEFTDKVRDLLNGGKVSRMVETFNNKVIGMSEDKTGLYDAIGYYDLPEVWAERAESIV
jgi:hypothetical protein